MLWLWMCDFGWQIDKKDNEEGLGIPDPHHHSGTSLQKMLQYPGCFLYSRLHSNCANTPGMERYRVARNLGICKATGVCTPWAKRLSAQIHYGFAEQISKVESEALHPTKTSPVLCLLNKPTAGDSG